MNVRILNNSPVYDYRESCMTTLGKEVFEPLGKTGDSLMRWWMKQFIANHSTVRSVHFRIKDKVPKSVAMQIIRATKGHPQPYVQSSRPDWVGKERSKDPYEEKMIQIDFTPESFIAMCRQRLCIRTELRTRKVVESWVEKLKNSGDVMLQAVGNCCKPNCVWYGACPEIKGCGKFPKLSERFMV